MNILKSISVKLDKSVERLKMLEEVVVHHNVMGRALVSEMSQRPERKWSKETEQTGKRI